MKLLFFIPSLDYSGAAKQLVLLATGLPRERCTLRVCVLGRPSPWVETLRRAGIEVKVFGRHRLFDLQPWLRLHRAVRHFRPDVVHVWGLPELWLGLGLRRWSGGRLVVSAFLPPRDRALRASLLDRRVLRSTRYQVVAGGPAEAERCRRLGLTEDRIVTIPPAVALPAAVGGFGADIRRALGLPLQVRLIACLGPLERPKGFYDAIWALDILKYLYRDLHLMLLGGGSDQFRLSHFVRALHVTDQVHFIGCQPEVQPLLDLAEVAWVPSRAPRGTNAALEAMAAGRPVVAAHWPELAEIVADGETGALFPPGDKAVLARQTRLLLDDADRRRRLGEAGQKRVAVHFTVEEMVRRHVQLYGL